MLRSVACFTLESVVAGDRNDKATVEILSGTVRIEKNANESVRNLGVISIGDRHLG